MTTLALDRETSHYWDYIKDASNESKLTLITLISASMAGEKVVTTKTEPVKAHRFNALTDEQMEREMQGEPTPIIANNETSTADIIDANRGRLVNGLEKWL
jgi:hypothetical protein